MTEPELLIIDDLHATAGGKPILNGVNLTVRAGETHALMGPNGSGKSTLSNVLMGHPGYEATAGRVWFKGEDLLALPPEERDEAWEEANEDAEAEAASQNTRTLHGPRLAPSAPARARRLRSVGSPPPGLRSYGSPPPARRRRHLPGGAGLACPASTAPALPVRAEKASLRPTTTTTSILGPLPMFPPGRPFPGFAG